MDREMTIIDVLVESVARAQWNATCAPGCEWDASYVDGAGPSSLERRATLKRARAAVRIALEAAATECDIAANIANVDQNDNVRRAENIFARDELFRVAARIRSFIPEAPQ